MNYQMPPYSQQSMYPAQYQAFHPQQQMSGYFDDQRGSDSVNQEDTEEFRLKQSEISAMISDHEDEQSLFISEGHQRHSNYSAYDFQNQHNNAPYSREAFQMDTAGGGHLGPPQLARGVSEYTPQVPMFESESQKEAASQQMMNTDATPFQPKPFDSDQLQLVQCNSASLPMQQPQVNYFSMYDNNPAAMQQQHQMLGNNGNMVYMDSNDMMQEQHQDPSGMQFHPQYYGGGQYYDQEDDDGEFEDDGAGGGCNSTAFSQI